MSSPEPSPQEELPYRIVLRGSEAGTERVLARALSAELAHAIFKAAQSEYPQRRITLSRGDTTLADSGG